MWIAYDNIYCIKTAWGYKVVLVVGVKSIMDTHFDRDNYYYPLVYNTLKVRKTMSNEQWREEGNCKKCRRANYCSKPCKVAKIRLREAIRAKLAEKTGMDNFAEAIQKEFGISESDYILLHGLKEVSSEKEI